MKDEPPPGSTRREKALNRRICSLETEYALASDLLAGGELRREQLADRLEQAVLEDHLALPCNSSGRRRSPEPDSAFRVEVREGSFLENGSRFYYDAGHLEWSNPETAAPREAALYSRAADLNLARAVRRVQQELRAEHPGCWLMLAKNNLDYSGKSFGCHENYSMRRFDERGREFAERLEDDLVPFLVTRTIFTGAGRIGQRQPATDSPVAFQLSQRADFIECLCSPDARQKRSLINLRDEPLADGSRWRRLHLVLGDSNMSDHATFLKLGTTCLVLDLLEASKIGGQFALADPVDDLQRVSRNWQHSRLQLRGGARATALEIQRGYWRLAKRLSVAGAGDSETGAVLDAWGRALDDLEAGGQAGPSGLDWHIKKVHLFDRALAGAGADWQELACWSYVFERCRSLPTVPAGVDAVAWLGRHLSFTALWKLKRYVKKHRMDWRLFSSRRLLLDRLCEMDFRYHDIDRDRGLFFKIAAGGALAAEHQISDQKANKAQHRPPQHSRAMQRYRVICLCSRHRLSAELDWDKVVMAGPRGVLAMPDPFAETQPSLEELLRSALPRSQPAAALEASSGDAGRSQGMSASPVYIKILSREEL